MKDGVCISCPKCYKALQWRLCGSTEPRLGQPPSLVAPGGVGLQQGRDREDRHAPLPSSIYQDTSDTGRPPAKAEAVSLRRPVKAAAHHTCAAQAGRPQGPGALSLAPCCGQLPDAVVSERVPASREEELGAWPDSPRLCRPRALLLLPGKQVESEHHTPSNPLTTTLLRPPAFLKDSNTSVWLLPGQQEVFKQPLQSTHQAWVMVGSIHLFKQGHRPEKPN